MGAGRWDYPALVTRGVNVMDRDDFVAAEPQLDRYFAKPPDAMFEAVVTVDNGADPHRADFSLTKKAVGRPVGEALSEYGLSG
ncbi:MAG: hypothetical protein ACRDZ4_11245 [Egibacteraceae bacterium]